MKKKNEERKTNDLKKALRELTCMKRTAVRISDPKKLPRILPDLNEAERLIKKELRKNETNS
jgi:hypothetical protein